MRAPACPATAPIGIPCSICVPVISVSLRIATASAMPQPPTAVISIRRNPAYAGTFGYGKTRMQVQPGRGRPQQRRLPRAEWKVIVHDRYPAYVTWETFVRMQAILD